MMSCTSTFGRELASLVAKALQAVEYVANASRRVSWPEVASRFEWSERTTKWRLRKAVEAGLLESRHRAGYALTPGARNVNWSKTLAKRQEAAS